MKKRSIIGLILIPALLAAEPVWTEGEHGLWRLQFVDGTYLSASDVATNGVRGACTVTREGTVTRRVWRTDRADVTVIETPTGDGAVDMRAEVTPHGADAKMLELPANVRFRPETVRSFVYPGRGNSGIGMAFNAKFFQHSPEDKPTAWHAGPHTYDKGYRHLYGASLVSHPLDLPETNLVVTAEGKRWLGTDAAGLFSYKRTVMRPPAKGQSDVVLVDSPVGPYLSGKHFGGAGMLWRFGVAGGSHDRYAPSWEAIAIRRLLPRLAAKAQSRTRVAVVALRCGPKAGAFVPLAVSDWVRELKRSLPRSCTFETLADVTEMKCALTAPDTLLVINPYGEYFPCGNAQDYIPCLNAVRDFVRAGGNWVEAGGYSFFRPLVSGGYFSIRTPYPSLFSDFAHLTATDGSTVAWYGVQPRPPHEPWKNPMHFVPGETGAGGDARGGWFFHAFACWAKDGQTAKTPAVRIRTGADLEAALADYARANTLTRPMSDKVQDPAKVDLFRRAPLFFIGGTAKEKIAALEGMPVPSLIHYSDYLKGGFDKEYPDHLPPRPAFGTGEELLEFQTLARKKGHLVSPYTNPTWWCDHPRGPSFIAAGEAPLSLGFDRKPYHEQYSKNDGWTITFWHPAVQAANRKTVREFTVDYPVDLLFQDQCGARQWRWDFNPASPSPTAYAEGILAMNEEDSRVVPLGTEDGWDQVANQQTAICGCTWRIVPVPRPPWRNLFKDVYPADTWRIEPIATRLFHDKAFFYMHDLGSFVTNERTLAWMFAIGYQLSWRAGAQNYIVDKSSRAWYEWLQLLQDKVVSRIALQPVVAFAHDRAPLLALPGDPSREDDDGVVTARYGDVSVAVNLGDVPRTVAGKRLAAYGWWITAPGLVAAKLESETPYVEAEGRRWEYRPAPAEPAVPCQPDVAQKPLGATVTPGARIAVIDLEGVHGSWVKASVGDWKDALNASPLVTRHGLKVVSLRSAAEVRAALVAGRTEYFAIINPYGEICPVEGQGRWTEMIDAIRDYVAHGGIWVETGSASFYSAAWKDGSKWRREVIGLKGLGRLRSANAMADIDEPPVGLHASATAAEWFPPQVLKRIAATQSQVNRAPCDGMGETVFPLVEDGDGRAWFGCHRLGGWGCLWRIGGSNPDRELALAVVPAALLHQFENVPAPLSPAPYRKVTAVKSQ
jgi:hypothetical protein